MSTSNTGRWLEADIEKAAKAYEDRKVATLSKVDPPTLRIGGKTIFKANPFLDFVGCWRGAAIFIEAKSTAEPKLSICSGSSSGITPKQYESLHRWARAKAVTFVLWGHAGEIRLVLLSQLTERINAGVKHLKWEEAHKIEPGNGWVRFDFLSCYLRLLRATE